MPPPIISETKCTDKMFFTSSVITDLQVILACVWLGVVALNKRAGLLTEILLFIL